MIDINFNEKFYDVLGELMKSLVRGKTSKRASQMQSHLTFADAFVHGIVAISSVHSGIGHRCSPLLRFQGTGASYLLIKN